MLPTKDGPKPMYRLESAAAIGTPQSNQAAIIPRRKMKIAEVKPNASPKLMTPKVV
jgi:hypothetical protein